MDSEEILDELAKLINILGPDAEQVFDLAVYYEKIQIFTKLRDLIIEKDEAHDAIAVEVLSWAWQALS